MTGDKSKDIARSSTIRWSSVAITIVEFKRPSRDDYSVDNVKSDPFLQVIETHEKATDAALFSIPKHLGRERKEAEPGAVVLGE
jgi:hypothetical protein